MRISMPNGRTIGRFSTDDHVFHKHVHGSKHMLHEPIGWSIDIDVFNILQKLGCSGIEILDVETSMTYYVTFEVFEEMSITINRGYGDQLALAIQYWNAYEAGTQNAG